jgi:hypothetical protein
VKEEKETKQSSPSGQKERVEKRNRKSKKDREADKQAREEQAKIARVKESDLQVGGSSKDKLTLSDLFASINADVQEEA